METRTTRMWPIAGARASTGSSSTCSSSGSRAFGISLGILFAVLVASAVVGALGGMPEEEQGLIPEEWNSHRVAQFAAYAGVVAILAPIVEEVMFRGVGYGLL